MKKPGIGFICLFSFIASFFIVSGCSSKDNPSEGGTGASGAPGKTFCVMPFFKGKHPLHADESPGITFTCPIAGLCLEEKDLRTDADRVLSRLVQETMKKRFRDQVISLAESRAVYDGLARDMETDTPRSLARKMGAALNTDYIIVGNVWRFRERTGTALSAESPASVAFTLYLFDVGNGKRIWEATFDQTQQSLSDNLLQASIYFEHGAKWLTAEELAGFGVRKMFKTFPL